ncbi:hypothetical protein [Streptacidiphilus jiangxiensis]|uniref:Uncharacterized protein n=1 Tax=Streptacidiphilus jiangxiensis TaxID=235985 RepID=A0A1H7PYN0_STRJI|nr:hypothetical protein [Streptacidiphilus jiangxiensis]SEL40686.1 hypothetical protein SAMN05414137_108186 [Streptacidiphilus jiangxiensis]
MALSISTAIGSTFGSKQQPALQQEDIRPLSPWFFAFEGLMGAAYDVTRLHPDAWMVLTGLGLVNMVVGFTVFGRRRKLLRAMLKNGRSRKILVGLIALRVGVHGLLAALGTQVEGTAGHLAMAALMTAATVGLLWYDQRVTFRALGLAQ